MAQATDIAPNSVSSRSRPDWHARSKHDVDVSPRADETAGTQGHSRAECGLSFTGFDSFDEVRRGFEFGPNRPAFYPPKDAVFRPPHRRDMSVFSIASVSSYGASVDSGAEDTFGYQDGPSRPPSMDHMSMSMSMSVDDTFSFINRNKPRKRVHSDASSFYFQMHPYRRGHRRGPMSWARQPRDACKNASRCLRGDEPRVWTRLVAGVRTLDAGKPSGRRRMAKGGIWTLSEQRREAASSKSGPKTKASG